MVKLFSVVFNSNGYWDTTWNYHQYKVTCNDKDGTTAGIAKFLGVSSSDGNFVHSISACYKMQNKQSCTAPPGFDNTRTDFFLANTKSCGPHTANGPDDFFGIGDSYIKPCYKLSRFIQFLNFF